MATPPPSTPPFASPMAAGSSPAMPHPVVFLLLIVPFGLSTGYLTVTLGYQLTQKGVAAADVAGLIALSYLPQTWKFLWAPLVDTTLTRKSWYTLSAFANGLGMVLAGMSADEARVPLVTLGVLLVAGSFASTLLGMAVESLMAVSVPDSHRGRVAGWFQAGNLGGMGLGGGFALWLVQDLHWSTGASGGALFAVSAACCLALLRLREPFTRDHARASLAAHARDIFVDLWALVRSRIGALALVICFLPIGSGAAQNLWAVIAGDWHASAETVAVVNGALSGIVSAAGCLVGGWVCDRMDRKAAYCVYGALQLLAAIAMALSTRTSAQFVAWTTIYAFIQGLTYAGFSAVVLEAIGRTAAATKYSLLASLANMPIAYVTLIDGYANDRWGTRGMLLTEAVCGVVGILVFVALAGATRRRGVGRSAAGPDALNA
jgi:MFS family permease